MTGSRKILKLGNKLLFMRNTLTLFVSSITIAAALLISTGGSAQMAQSINGMVVSDFKTPQGAVHVTLPDDLRQGDHITGTVSVTPEGKTEGERQQNLQKLSALTLQLPGMEMTLHDLLKENQSNQFNFTVPRNISNMGGNLPELELLDNGKNIGASIIPIMLVNLLNTPTSSPTIQLQNPLIEQGEPFAVFRSPNADMNKYEAQVTDKNGQKMTVEPMCSSPREMIVALPPNVSIGPGTITARPRQAGSPSESISFTYEKISAEYKIQKNNLKKDETTLLNGTIRGLSSPQMHNPALELTNTTSQIVKVQGGDHQIIPLSPDPNGEAHFQRLITGITLGQFDLLATVKVDPRDISDPVERQMRCLRTSDEYNNWVEALKSDLKNFAQSQPNDKTGSANRQNAATILQNLWSSNNDGDVETTKKYNANLLRSLVTDPKKMETWDCTFMAEQAAMDPLRDVLMNKASYPVDYEMLKEFADNIQMRAEMAGYDKRKGPMINNLLLQLAMMRIYAEGTPKCRSLQHDLYRSISGAVNALPDDVLPRYNRPDPVNDFVGFLDPGKKKLWVLPQDVNGNIIYGGATKGERGMYSFTGKNIFGQPVPCSFGVNTFTAANLRLLFKRGADIPMNGAANQKDSTKKDSTKKDSANKGTADTSFKEGFFLRKDTVNGTIYKFYKNAKCEKFFYSMDPEPGMSDCTPEKSRRWKNGQTDKDIIDKVNKNPNYNTDDDIEEYETGRYIKRETRQLYKCAKGTQYCDEILVSYITIHVYDNAGCTLEVATYPAPWHGRAFSCQH